jgi:quinolinate synthase
MGVDFMSESVRATLDSQVKGGGKEVNPIPVYRLSEKKIGCSLAEAAERQAYNAFLEKASHGPGPPSLRPSPSLHVVYINTSLVTKALSHEILPTITCTSSNVLSTLLSAYAQIPNLNIYYGPDTYMGANLESLLQRLAALPPSLPSSLEIVRKLHPAHTPETIKELLPRFHYFKVPPSLPPSLPPSRLSLRSVRRDHHTARPRSECPGKLMNNNSIIFLLIFTHFISLLFTK